MILSRYLLRKPLLLTATVAALIILTTCPAFCSDANAESVTENTQAEEINKEAAASEEPVAAAKADKSPAAPEKPAAAAKTAPVSMSVGTMVTKMVVEDELRKWKIAALEEEDALRRERNEMLLRESMLARYKIDHGADLPEDLKIYYICVNEMDYIVCESGEDIQVYLACITKQGEYFVSTENLIDEVIETVSRHMTEENLTSSAEFWNKITLMDKPDGIIDGNSLRPVDENGIMCVPYFNQGAGFYDNGEWTYTDWPNIAFNVNGHTMHQAGCGFFSTAMALSYVKQELIAPVDFKENGEYIADNGSAVTVGVNSAAMYGVPAYLTGDWKTVLSALINGHPVMEHVGPSVFTSGGHYILLVGVLPDGRIAVNDPGHKDNTYWYCNACFPQDVIRAAEKGGNLAYTVFG